jgi:hypothetical protein
MPDYTEDKLPSGLDQATLEQLDNDDLFTVEDVSESQVKKILKSEFSNLISSELEVIAAERIMGYGLFGTGEDGNVTISVNTTLTRDMHYNVLTINTGIVLSTGGFRVFAWEIAGSGTISDKGGNGGNASSGTGGARYASTRSPGYLPAPNRGANGGNAGANGTGGTNSDNAIGSNGIAGKNSGSHSGGTAGTANALAATSGGMRNYANLQLWRAFDSTTFVSPTGHGTNGGSAGGASGGGGASGDNGGYAMVFARTISGTITIDVSGGTGGNGAIDGSGGNGGNGGVIGFIYHIITGTITHIYTGGAGGSAGGASGSIAGVSGNTGILISLQL